MSRQWTKEQGYCLDARGGTVLVSAAAGSGKTTVLVERVIRRLTDEQNPVDADRLLVVTFTKAAAAEMKQRISVELSKKMAADPQNRRLQRQQMLLPRAHISTVHGFCSSLLRENFHLLGISPQFTIAEDGDMAVLRQEALNEIMEEAYTKEDEGFTRLNALLSNGKNDKGLCDTVLRLYGFIQSHPFPDEWLNKQEEWYTVNTSINDTPWGKTIRGYIAGTLRHAASMMHTLYTTAMTEEQMAEAYGGAFLLNEQRLTRVADEFEKAPWDDAMVMVKEITFEKVKNLTKYPYPEFKKQVSKLHNDTKDQVKSLSSMAMSEQECREDIASLAPMVQALCRLVKEFGRVFQEKKEQKHLLDYNDLEHLSLKLLLTRDDDGTLHRTPLAEELSGFYDEVLVDECQDTNAAQDALFTALSRDESNLFMVGDVKQSIYGFRQAMPEIFIGRQKAYRDYDGKHFPAVITLGHNFRSRETVTDSVNFLFSQLMSEDLGGLRYDEHHELIPGAPYENKADTETEFYIINGGDREETDSKDAAEARLIADRIRYCMEHMTIDNKGKQRPAKYSDFCILLRSTTGHATTYAKELAKAGIPAWTATSGGFFEAPEVSMALSLLRLIDNPTQDVPLLAVLLSPLAGFTPDDLATIRQNRLRLPLYVAMRDYIREQPDHPLAKRCSAFLEEMEHYRRLAATLPADQLIHRLLEETGLYTGYSARSNSDQRIANLRLLHQLARRFEKGKFRGLSAFVRHMDRLEEQNAPIAPASTLSEQADVVRIITIHHSKGLEFPVVFLAGLGQQFNNESTKNKLLLHADKGMGLVMQDQSTRQQWSTFPHMAVARSIRQTERAEELRLLYVALTRAKEKLYLIMTAKDPASRLLKASTMVTEEPVLPAFGLQQCGCLGEWVMAALLRHPSASEFRKILDKEDLPLLPAKMPWKIQILPTPPTVEEAKTTATAVADADTVDLLRERMAYAYPHRSATTIPSKLAASALSHHAMAVEHIAEQRPAFLEKQTLSAAERGTAAHTFMECADFTKAKDGIEAEADRLRNMGLLTEEERKALPIKRLQTFFDSDLCRRMMASSKQLKEHHFTVDIEPDFFGYESEDKDRIVVQGIVDAAFWDGDGWVIVDYKTDYVTEESELVHRYTDQLRVYKAALEKTLSDKVKECRLYSFHLGKAILCDIE